MWLRLKVANVIYKCRTKPVPDDTLACISYADIKSKRYNVRLISLDDYIFKRNSEMADNAEIIAKYSSLEQLVDDGWVLY